MQRSAAEDSGSYKKAAAQLAENFWARKKSAAQLMTPVKIWLGYPYPLGATWLGNGVNFAIFSETATSVDLCLFDKTA